MAGTLYLCATPIGNLEDMTFRAIRTLKEVDLIAAEDTRNTIRLLNHFEIKTPMTSYHEYNKIEKAAYLVQKILDGTNVAVVTDAGTPGISDPGEELVRQAFEAFLPHDKKERRTILESLTTETRTTVIYEAPHHLKATLLELYNALGDRKITLCRELTKLHETIQQFTLETAIDYYSQNAPKGEYVLVLEGISQKELDSQAQASWEAISLPEHMERYLAQNMDKKTAMKKVAQDRGISKRDVYQALLEQKEN